MVKKGEREMGRVSSGHIGQSEQPDGDEGRSQEFGK
jgi:hypothetical protein